MFYEQKHSSNKKFISISPNVETNASFPLHLHTDYELIYVEEGILQVRINESEFDVASGEGILILPNQPHEFLTPKYSKTWLVIFSSDYISELKKVTGSKNLFHPVIKVGDPDFRSRLIKNKDNPLRIKSILYEIAALYCEGESAPDLATDDGALVCRVVEYIDAHYAEQISLEMLSQTLGYSYRYMSGVVNRFFKMPFPNVVNRYRVSHACMLLSDTEKEITEIAMICGFGSIRSFNRNFKAVMGMSPREYKKEKP